MPKMNFKKRLAELRAERKREGGPCDGCFARIKCWPYERRWLCRDCVRVALKDAPTVTELDMFLEQMLDLAKREEAKDADKEDRKNR